MTEPSNDNERAYVQAVLVLLYGRHEDYREEYREAFASCVDRLKEMAERVYHAKPDLISVTLWFAEEKQAWVYNGPRENR
jgi:hypothetical protein